MRNRSNYIAPPMTALQVWLNGRLMPAAEAHVSLFDSGFQHAVGVFTSMTARHGAVFRLDEHLERLQSSAVSLGAVEALHIGPLAQAVGSVLAYNELSAARVRVTVTAGDLKLLRAPGSSRPAQRGDPTVAIVAQPPTDYPEEFFAKGVRVRVCDWRVPTHDAFAGHKTLWYWPRLAELQVAARVGCSEGLVFTTANRLSCGCVSNVFLVKDGELRTPACRTDDGHDRAPVLPGITRQAIIDCARDRGITVRTMDLTIEDILAADEIFLTNSSWGVLPVIGMEQHTVGTGTVGAMTADLRCDYLETLDFETRHETRG
jgi:branched-subunit amino acid aminotransferase/4-amino-4-deoxychorismate lyase